MNSILAKHFLKDYKKKSDPILKEILLKKQTQAFEFGRIPLDLHKQISKLAFRGKGIRGALTTLGYEINGGEDKKTILHASLVMELFHLSLLIHDDIMDKAVSRRGLPSVHKYFQKRVNLYQLELSNKRFGTSLAICAGDGLFYLSWEHLLKTNFSKERIIEAGKLYAEYAYRAMNGQVLDVSLNRSIEIKEEDILKIIYLKSGEYTCELPLLFGAALARKISKEKRNAIKKYAQSLGWAFQIQDDILGIFGGEQETGKPNTADLCEGKMTLLMLHLNKHGNQQQRNIQKKLLGKKNISVSEVELMRKTLKESGSYQYVVDLGWKYIQQGKQQIAKLTQNKKRKELLESLLIFMMERVK